MNKNTQPRRSGHVGAVDAIERELCTKPLELVQQIARDTAALRGTTQYTNEHAIIAQAAGRVLTAQYRGRFANMTTRERIDAIRDMPNVKRDPVQRAEYDAIEETLWYAYPAASEVALEWCETIGDTEGERYPESLADAYERAAIDAGELEARAKP